MMVWEKLFNQRVLQRGKEYADNGKVSNIQYKPGELCATINGRERYDVKISFDKSKNITRMHCTCPSATEIYYWTFFCDKHGILKSQIDIYRRYNYGNKQNHDAVF